MHYLKYKYTIYIHMHCLILVHPLNAISLKFYSSMQQQVKLLPTNRKVAYADGNSLCPIGEVHVKFKLVRKSLMMSLSS